ncbi:acetyltransferase, GNAT family [Candidatus Vecturithrix granuli]|uniref:Acetyltransferase, GNAT family n=1 Tax=Vecturithrix granuli TaxID=1499967 RepID=A0A081BXE0_VECG1|nr:acetyltransferase, GNAT family [Candidatus Vecturithrix granuli]
MNNLILIHNYKDFLPYRHSFNQLARETFGIDFEQWYLDGHWNDRYICYSYLNDDQVVANVSVSKLTLILEGQRRNALQIGTVMTHPAYQRKGLSKALMQIVLDAYETKYDLIYLFANLEAAEFYPRFGFKTLSETQFALTVNIRKAHSKSLRKMNPRNSSDRGSIDRLIKARQPLSFVCGVEQAEHILAFYSYNILHDAWYYYEEEDVIVMCRQDHETLHLYDIIATHPVDFDTLACHLAQEEDIRKIMFYFTPDLLNIESDVAETWSEDYLFIKPVTFTMASSFKYPITAQA